MMYFSASLTLKIRHHTEFGEVHFLTLIKSELSATETIRREEVENLTNVALGSLDELVDDIRLEFQTFSERDRHDAGTDFIGLRSTEG